MKKRMIMMVMATMVMASVATGCGNANTAPADVATDALTNVTSDVATDDTSATDWNEYVCVEEADSDFAFDSSVAPSNGAVNGTRQEAEKMMTDEACATEALADNCIEEGFYVEPMEEFVDAPDFNTEEYSTIIENSFADVKTSPLSTFAADVDTASYSNLRRMINDGYTADYIPSGAIRIEEMINYFDYDYVGPKKDEPFGVNAMISDCPWNEDNKLLMLGLQTEEIDFSEAGDSNIVFLIDVSGSMYDEDKLPLLKQAFGMLVENLGEKDRVSIVTYASRDEVVLKGVPGCNQKEIMNALNSLEAGGSTNGGEGIITAYELAEKYFIEGGNNRIILATDGDLNVGITSQSELHDLVAEKKESGVFLSVLGFGWGNYSDTNMETLADYGNGNYSYIDSLSEAKKVLVKELGATMVTVAKDVKLQVEFNPAVVSEYRLIGYENRTMAAEDFADDTKDAGEIGAGHSVTALYELVLNDGKEDKDSQTLKYQDSTLSEKALKSDEWLTLSVRYKEPDGNKSKLLEYPIGNKFYTNKPSDDFIFASSVAEFGMLLRGSKYINDVNYIDIAYNLNKLDNLDEYKEEFVGLVEEMWRRD